MSSNYWFEAEEVSAIKNDYQVVRNLSLKLKDEENVLILGPNGSGKSSIVDLINRNIYPMEKRHSSFKILNRELINIWELRSNINSVNNEIKSRINSHLKVYDLILSGLYGKYCKVKNPNSRDLEITEQLINQMSLSKISMKNFGSLSDGEKQIALIARAIVNNPKILILDEPSINLDIKSKLFLTNKIIELSKKGICILCITHDIDMITENYHRVILLKDREIIADGKPNEIINTNNINKLFDINVKIIKHSNKWSLIK